MNQSKIKKALRKNINHWPEHKQKSHKIMLHKASIQDSNLFEKLVNRLARKRNEKDIQDSIYTEFQNSPEYSAPYKWSRNTPRKDS